jgi:hypothetical protein
VQDAAGGEDLIHHAEVPSLKASSRRRHGFSLFSSDIKVSIRLS